MYGHNSKQGRDDIMEDMNWIVSVASQGTEDWIDMAKTWHPSVALQMKENLEQMGVPCRILHQVGNVRLKEDLSWEQALEMGRFMEDIQDFDEVNI